MSLFHVKTSQERDADSRPDAIAWRQVAANAAIGCSYYWAHLSPDGKSNSAPYGPFTSEAEAIANAREGGAT